MGGGDPTLSKQVRRTLLPVVTEEGILDTGLEGGTVVEGITVGIVRLITYRKHLNQSYILC